MESSITLEDNIFDMLKLDEMTQRLVEAQSKQVNNRLVDEDSALSERQLITIYLRAASIKHAYKREVYGSFDYLGDLGGMFSMVSLIAYYCTSKIV